MKHIVAFVLFVTVFGCKHGMDEPSDYFAMRAYVNYQTTPVSLELRGEGFRMSGPFEVPFDTAEVFLAEGSFGNRQLIATTAKTNLPLPMLTSGVMYYVTVRGKKGQKESVLTQPVVATSDVIRTTRKLLTDNTFGYKLSPLIWPVAYTERNSATSMWVNYLLDTTGRIKALPPLPSDDGYSSFVRWTNNGQDIVYGVNQSKRLALFSYNLSSGQYTALPMPTTTSPISVVLSPDGKRMAYVEGLRRTLYYFDMATKTERVADEQPANYSYDYSLTWTPDSQCIIFRNYLSSGAVVVNQYHTQTQQTAITTLREDQLSNLKMSPDGKHILYTSNLPGNTVLWLLNRETGTLRAVGPSYRYDWLSDGSFWCQFNATDRTGQTPADGTIWQFTP